MRRRSLWGVDIVCGRRDRGRLVIGIRGRVWRWRVKGWRVGVRRREGYLWMILVMRMEGAGTEDSSSEGDDKSKKNKEEDVYFFITCPIQLIDFLTFSLKAEKINVFI
jgi:hypothetical protein